MGGWGVRGAALARASVEGACLLPRRARGGMHVRPSGRREQARDRAHERSLRARAARAPSHPSVLCPFRTRSGVHCPLSLGLDGCLV